MFLLCKRKNCFKRYFNIARVQYIMVLLCIISHTSGDTRALDKNAHTIYYDNQPANKTGHFKFEFQTSNGITTKAAGNEYGVSGVVQYVSLEGVPITLTYVADSDGYHPTGDHIPKIPLHVTKSLEYIRTHAPVDEEKSRDYNIDLRLKKRTADSNAPVPRSI